MQHFSQKVAWYAFITRRLVMLRLSVNKGEYLMVGKDVKIVFLGGNNSTLKLTIDAPKEVIIARGKAIKKHEGENLPL
jgi:carbon storage regulator